MSTVPVSLKHGLKLGDVPQLEAVLREATAGIIIEASEEAEKLVATPDGYQLVQSPTMVGAHALRRQIVQIGGIPGPLELKQLKALHPEDLALLQEKVQQLDGAAVASAARAGVAQGGRDDGPASAG